MYCQYSLVVALAVILCFLGVNGTQTIYGPCNINAPSKPAIGQYVAQCTSMGLYEIVQKHPSTGYRWCVNPMTGEKIEGSEVGPGIFSKPTCGKCLYDLEKAVVTTAMWGIGGTTPQCDAKGLYNALQSSAGTGYSWCVNPETGDIIKGSEVHPGAGRANCDTRQKRETQPIFGPCNINSPSTPPKLGQYVPQCTKWGLFEIVQKNPSTGYRWCVNPMTGVKVEGTDLAPGMLSFLSKPKCGKCLYDLEKAVITTAMWGIGGATPECDANGQYNALQNSAGTGYSWCVDTETGAKIKGSEVAPGAGQAKC